MEWDSTKIRVYELPYMLKEGDTLIIKRYEDADTLIVIEGKCWYFLIDDCPMIIYWCYRHILVYCDLSYDIIIMEFAGLPDDRVWSLLRKVKW